MSFSTANEENLAQNQASASLESCLEPNYEVQDVVSSFIKPVYDLYSENSPSEVQLADALNRLWNALLDKALSIPYNDIGQGRLIDFVKKVKSLTPPDHPAVKIWGLSLWSDLPVLGATIRQRWNTGSNAENDEWQNLNAFAARLVASQIVDLSLYAIWTIRDALETPLEDIKCTSRDQSLRAAAVWIELCGDHLRSLNQTWEPHPTKGDPARGGPLYSGPHGFCEQRWKFWGARFRILGSDESLGWKTRRILADTADKMDA